MCLPFVPKVFSTSIVLIELALKFNTTLTPERKLTKKHILLHFLAAAHGEKIEATWALVAPNLDSSALKLGCRRLHVMARWPSSQYPVRKIDETMRRKLCVSELPCSHVIIPEHLLFFCFCLFVLKQIVLFSFVFLYNLWSTVLSQGLRAK